MSRADGVWPSLLVRLLENDASAGTTAVKIAIGLLPDQTGAVKTYTVKINQALPELCRSMSLPGLPAGSYTYVVKDCAERCAQLHGGAAAPIPMGCVLF